jgi:hypothetical protein
MRRSSNLRGCFERVLFPIAGSDGKCGWGVDVHVAQGFLCRRTEARGGFEFYRGLDECEGAFEEGAVYADSSISPPTNNLQDTEPNSATTITAKKPTDTMKPSAPETIARPG